MLHFNATDVLHQVEQLLAAGELLVDIRRRYEQPEEEELTAEQELRRLLYVDGVRVTDLSWEGYWEVCRDAGMTKNTAEQRRKRLFELAEGIFLTGKGQGTTFAGEGSIVEGIQEVTCSDLF